MIQGHPASQWQAGQDRDFDWEGTEASGLLIVLLGQRYQPEELLAKEAHRKADIEQ